MAKKQTAKPDETPEKAEAAPAKEEKSAKKEPKKAKEPKAKTAPTAPDAESAPAAAPAAAPAVAAGPGETKKRGRQPGNPPPLGKKLKNHIDNVKQRLAKEGPMPVKRAIGLLKQLKRAKFDETVEVHMALGVDPAQNDQMVRGSVPLPHGIGKSVRVVVFCQGDNVAKAKEAGADFAGSDELIGKIQQEGWLDFDVALTTQDMMGKVSRLGKILGPRGLMPTPKAGTVVPANGDVAAAVREFKAGKVEFRADKGGNVHAGVGKMSFDEDKLAANITAFIDQVKAVKPSGVKGNYVKSITLSATMSPGIPVSV
ncbi:MAG TPA: 50S ribosomal protein L1 [Gemmataceae bacterium]|jgi:large subunit ribosomal protein L1|nr:50S ribosomal protein L1 [Gemmataceae bacterium]